MNTKITITLNGSVAPKQKFQLGYKFENVGDTLTFIIPTQYWGYNHYLAVQRTTLTEEEIEEEITPSTMLFPVNIIDGQLVFIISNTITQNPGNYNLIFLSTENKVKNGNVQEANQVFVSNTFTGYITDSFLTNPVNEETLDANIQIIYDSLLNLRNELEQKVADDYYRGRYYNPSLNSDGYLSWTIEEGIPNEVPAPQNITGPQGPKGNCYVPELTVNENNEQILVWKENASDTGIETPSVNLNELTDVAATKYLDTNLEDVVDKSVNEAFQWIWDPTTKSLYLYATKDSTTINEDQYNSILESLRDTTIPSTVQGSLDALNSKYTELENKYKELLEKIENGTITPTGDIRAVDTEGNNITIYIIDEDDNTTQNYTVVYQD